MPRGTTSTRWSGECLHFEIQGIGLAPEIIGTEMLQDNWHFEDHGEAALS
jgi:hypothetical protein